MTPDADQIVADPGRIEQVIENLVANALRHTPDGGPVHLDASIAEGSTALSVEDTGEGIARSTCRTSSIASTRPITRERAACRGSGLGLSITKAIVERHGGSISVDQPAGPDEVLDPATARPRAQRSIQSAGELVAHAPCRQQQFRIAPRRAQSCGAGG